MSLHLVLWEIDETKIVYDIREQDASRHRQSLADAVNRDLGDDTTPCRHNVRGRAVVDGQVVDTMRALSKYAPYVQYKLYPMGNITNTETWIEILKTGSAVRSDPSWRAGAL